MARTPNPMRAKLQGRNPAFGSAIFSWSANVVDAAGAAELDFVRFDSETSWRRDSSMEEMVRAAILNDLVPIVRIDRDDPLLVRKALEIGAGAIMVPDVRSVAEARAIVDAAKFPPRGNRGYSSNCFSAAWGDEAGEGWVKWSDSEPLIGIVVESPSAVAAIDDIVAVDGIDFVQFGAADYAMALGLGAPNPDNERVQDAMRRTYEAVRAAGRFIYANIPADPKAIRRNIELGVMILELANDIGLLRSAWRKARQPIDP